MAVELAVACNLLGDVITGTDPAVFTGADCALLAELLARTENRCAGMRTLLAAWAALCGAHKDRGFSDPAIWLADAAGISGGEAKSALDTAERLEDCPETRAALLAGDVSLDQAAEITKTAAAVAGSEADMLEVAGRSPLAALRDEGRRRRLGAQDVEEAHRRRRRERYVRHWRDDDGMHHLAAAWPDEDGIPIINRIDAEVERLLRQARKDKKSNGSVETEPVERLAADALSSLVMGGGRGRSRRADRVLVCDVAAFQRGHRDAGETCHVIGGGPVPVSVARELAVTAFIKGVLHNGKVIENVVHYNKRYRPAELQTALDLGDPPLFAGVACVDCGRRYGIAWDHVDPFTHGGPTSYENLDPRCVPCHLDKTRRDRAAGLLAPRLADSPHSATCPSIDLASPGEESSAA